MSFMGQRRIAVCTFHAPTVENIQMNQNQNVMNSVFAIKQRMLSEDLRDMRNYLNNENIPYKMEYSNNILTFRTTIQGKDRLQNRAQSFVDHMLVNIG